MAISGKEFQTVEFQTILYESMYIHVYPSEPGMFEKVEKKVSGVNEERGVGKEVGEIIGAGQDR